MHVLRDMNPLDPGMGIKEARDFAKGSPAYEEASWTFS